MTAPEHIAIIGFGEVGSIFARDLKAAGVERITAYDPLFDDPESGPSRSAARLNVQACANAPEAATGASLVICAVTAAQALAAAKSVIGGIGQGAYFLDLNSASPRVKAQASRDIDAAGGRYVEAAVMTSVPPKGLKSAMLLGGLHAEGFIEWAAPLGLEAKFCSADVGVASATKMCRSVMIKGTEALLAECLLTARHYGVEKAVLGSLGDMLPNPDWEKLARYMISRSLIHGRRRAEEMREVARTVEDAGVDPWMSAAAAERQDWAARTAKGMDRADIDGTDLYPFLDAIIAAMKSED